MKKLNNKLNNDAGLNEKLNETIAELNNKLNTLEQLNEKLNNEIERLNTELNTIERLNENQGGLNNMESAAVKSRLNIMGWTVAKSGRYFRAFKKIGGKLHGVHLGASIEGAEGKIRAKVERITGGQDTE